MRLISFLSSFSSRTQPSQSPRFAHLSLFLWLNMHFYKCHFPDPLSTAFCKTQLRHICAHRSVLLPAPSLPPTHIHITPSRFSHGAPHGVRAHYLTGIALRGKVDACQCVCT